MTDEVSNLIIEHLRALRAGQDCLQARIEELTARMGGVEVAVAGLRRDVAHLDSDWAEQSVRADGLAARVDRIERRLELIE
jgi:hypothetical protein